MILKNCPTADAVIDAKNGAKAKKTGKTVSP